MIRNTWNNWFKCSFPFIFHHICYGKMKEKFSESSTDIFISQWNPPNSCFKAWISLKYSLLPNSVKKTHNFIQSERKYKVESQNIRSMQIMQELPTNKPNFPFKYTEDFNQTTHVPPYEPIVFNDNISFYCNSLNSVQEVLKEPCHGNFNTV